jgi:hypothetical protein
LDRIAKFGRPLQFVEFAYPADPTGMTVAPNPQYPFTPNGQAAFVRDFAAAVRGKVEATHYFDPDYYKGFDTATPELESIGLFSAAATANPALDIFNAIAERRLLP